MIHPGEAPLYLSWVLQAGSLGDLLGADSAQAGHRHHTTGGASVIEYAVSRNDKHL